MSEGKMAVDVSNDAIRAFIFEWGMLDGHPHPQMEAKACSIIWELRRLLTEKEQEWQPIEKAPDGVPVLVRQRGWYCTAVFSREHHVGHWTDGAAIVHYNGTILVPSFRFSPGAEFKLITQQEDRSDG